MQNLLFDSLEGGLWYPIDSCLPIIYECIYNNGMELKQDEGAMSQGHKGDNRTRIPQYYPF